MKVCYISSSYPPFPCGVGDYVKNLTDILHHDSLSITVITSENPMLHISSDGQVEIKPIIRKWTVSSWVKIFKEILKEKNELIHFQYPTQYPVPRSLFFRFLPLTLPMAILCFLFGKKISRIFTVHEYYKNGIFTKLKVQIDAILSEKVIVVTPIDEQLLKSNRLLKNKVKFIPVGPNLPVRVKDAESIVELRNSIGVKKHETLVCFFGFLAENRGFEDIIDAVAMLIKRGEYIRVIVIGAVIDPIYIATLKKRAEKFGVSSSFIWAGFIEPDCVSDYILASDLMVQPYHSGANTNRGSLIAAICLGVPTITTYVEGITPEIFIKSNAVILCRPNSSDDIGLAISAFIGDGATKSRLLKNMPRLAEHFSWENIAKEVHAIYDEVYSSYALR